jgi:hypothetical protein
MCPRFPAQGVVSVYVYAFASPIRSGVRDPRGDAGRRRRQCVPEWNAACKAQCGGRVRAIGVAIDCSLLAGIAPAARAA